MVADSRAPRDGKYIEKLGLYNPTTKPPTIDLDFDKALDWVQKGAKPTDTCRSILSRKGVMLKKHLLKGVRKNAISEEEAERRFNEWLSQQEEKVRSEREAEISKKRDEERQRLEAERKISDARAEELAKKNADEAEKEKPEAKGGKKAVEEKEENKQEGGSEEESEKKEE
ncbi:MAG: 30S ribosomal protein S16, partial [Bacteroidota bacterium]